MEAIPEYLATKELEFKGDYEKALPLMHRVQEVLDNVTTKNSLLSVAASIRLARLYRYLGKYDQAKKCLSLQQLHGIPKAYALQMASSCSLLQGTASQALEYAEEACSIAESQNESDSDVMLFYGCYTMKGLSLLCDGQSLSAEDYLQQAARWSNCNDLAAELGAMSNLGALHWFNYWEELRTRTKNDIVTSAASGVPGSNILVPEKIDEHIKAIRMKHVGAALSFWENGLLGCTVSDTASGTSSQISSGMCGPSAEAVLVPAGSTSGIDGASAVIRSDSETDLQNKLNQDVDLAVAYTSLIWMAGMAANYLDEDDRSSKYLKDALDVTDKISKSCPNNNSLPPVLLAVNGNILREIGLKYAAAGEFVTAEGCFRSATDAYKSTYALHDPRLLLVTLNWTHK